MNPYDHGSVTETTNTNARNRKIVAELDKKAAIEGKRSAYNAGRQEAEDKAAFDRDVAGYADIVSEKDFRDITAADQLARSMGQEPSGSAFAVAARNYTPKAEIGMLDSFLDNLDGAIQGASNWLSGPKEPSFEDDVTGFSGTITDQDRRIQAQADELAISMGQEPSSSAYATAARNSRTPKSTSLSEKQGLEQLAKELNTRN